MPTRMRRCEVLPAPVAGAAETLAALKRARLRRRSDQQHRPHARLGPAPDPRRLGLGAASIDAMVFSNEHGHCKPRPSIFEELRAGLGVRLRARWSSSATTSTPTSTAHSAAACARVHFDPPMRGTAVAPHVDHGLEITADARVTTLAELVRVIESMERQ